MSNLLKKFVLVVVIAALGFAALPAVPAYALGEREGERPELTDERLAEIWAKEVALFEKQGQFLDNADNIIAKVEDLIARLQEQGIDTSTVEAALAAFEDAVRAAKPVHAQANGIVNSHKGFDDNGQVVDREEAIESIRALGANLKEFRATMGNTLQGIRQAISALREANGGQRPARPEGERPTRPEGEQRPTRPEGQEQAPGQ